MSSAGSGSVCPQCDKQASGNFCQHCGAALGGRFCSQCGGEAAANAKFCNQCGSEIGRGAIATPAGAGAGASAAGAAGGPVLSGPQRRTAAVEVVGGQNLAWWIAGVAMFALIVVIGVQMVRPGPPAAPAAGGSAPAAAGAGVAPDISQMSPTEAADRLFNRVMTAISAGDSAQAQAFVPMAIAAHDRARPLDHDRLFHLSMLNRTAMNLDAALDNALEVLEEDPNHLLALAAAAEAAIELGLEDEAEAHYRQLLAVYDDEVNRALDEYDQHSQIVVVLKDDAERYLSGR